MDTENNLENKLENKLENEPKNEPDTNSESAPRSASESATESESTDGSKSETADRSASGSVSESTSESEKKKVTIGGIIENILTLINAAAHVKKKANATTLGQITLNVILIIAAFVMERQKDHPRRRIKMEDAYVPKST